MTPDPEITKATDSERPDVRDVPGARGQGRQMDAGVRKAIENAAQDRRMQHYGSSYAAVPTTRLDLPGTRHIGTGEERIYLEAKGTQGRGDSLIVIRNEVNHAGFKLPCRGRGRTDATQHPSPISGRRVCATSPLATPGGNHGSTRRTPPSSQRALLPSILLARLPSGSAVETHPQSVGSPCTHPSGALIIPVPLIH